jgi:hypothetical protein
MILLRKCQLTPKSTQKLKLLISGDDTYIKEAKMKELWGNSKPWKKCSAVISILRYLRIIDTIQRFGSNM